MDTFTLYVTAALLVPFLAIFAGTKSIWWKRWRWPFVVIVWVSGSVYTLPNYFPDSVLQGSIRSKVGSFFAFVGGAGEHLLSPPVYFALVLTLSIVIGTLLLGWLNDKKWSGRVRLPLSKGRLWAVLFPLLVLTVALFAVRFTARKDNPTLLVGSTDTLEVAEDYARVREWRPVMGSFVDSVYRAIYSREYGAADTLIAAEIGRSKGDSGKLAGLYSMRGLRFAHDGKNQEALEQFDVGLTYLSDLPDLWINKGISFGALGQYEDAIRSYDSALVHSPGNPFAWYQRGDAQKALLRFQEAVASFDSALIYRRGFALAWSGRGEALLSLGRFEEALASYDEALTYENAHRSIWNGRGNALFYLGRHKEALASYDSAIERTVCDYQAWYNKGNALQSLGRFRESIDCYDKALGCNSGFSSAWNNRGLAYLALGRAELALENVEEALRHDDQNWHALKLKSVLDEMEGF